MPLTPKAFELLVALVARGGRLVEKDDLMRVVWGELLRRGLGPE